MPNWSDIIATMETLIQSLSTITVPGVLRFWNRHHYYRKCISSYRKIFILIAVTLWLRYNSNSEVAQKNHKSLHLLENHREGAWPEIAGTSHQLYQSADQYFDQNIIGSMSSTFKNNKHFVSDEEELHTLTTVVTAKLFHKLGFENCWLSFTTYIDPLVLCNTRWSFNLVRSEVIR